MTLPPSHSTRDEIMSLISCNRERQNQFHKSQHRRQIEKDVRFNASDQCSAIMLHRPSRSAKLQVQCSIFPVRVFPSLSALTTLGLPNPDPYSRQHVCPDLPPPAPFPLRSVWDRQLGSQCRNHHLSPQPRPFPAHSRTTPVHRRPTSHACGRCPPGARHPHQA